MSTRPHQISENQASHNFRATQIFTKVTKRISVADVFATHFSSVFSNSVTDEDSIAAITEDQIKAVKLSRVTQNDWVVL